MARAKEQIDTGGGLYEPGRVRSQADRSSRGAVCPAAQPLFTSEWNEELKIRDVSWLSPAGTDMMPGDWTDGNARCLGMMLDGRAQATGIKKPSSDATLLLIFNSYHDIVQFKLPKAVGGTCWELLIETNQPDCEDTPQFAFEHEYG